MSRSAPTQQIAIITFPNFLVSAALVVGLGNNVYANEKFIEPVELRVAINKEKKEKEFNSISSGDSTRFVSGKVIDWGTKEELSGATVIVKVGRIAVTTNVNGVFKLVVPDHVAADTIQLTVTAVNYFDQTVTYTIKDFPLYIPVELKPTYLLVELHPVRESFIPPLSGKIACCFIREPTAWQRLKRRIRKYKKNNNIKNA
jgi:hypothetical protein